MIGLFVVTMVLNNMVHTPVVFFPDNEPNTANAYIKMPVGTEIKTTDSVAKMVEKAPSWGGKLIEVLEKSVGKFPWLGKGLVDTVKSWVGIFSKAGKNMNAISSLGRPAVRKLTNNTKFYLGLLDSLGLGNFSGPPEELAKKVPNLAQKVADFEATPEGKNLSMGGTMGPTEPSTTPSQTTFTPPKAPSTTKTDDPISMLSSMLM
jgi:hypothetical protein